MNYILQGTSKESWMDTQDNAQKGGKSLSVGPQRM